MKASLHHIQPEAENIRTYFFKPERPLRYVAGQFIEMTIPHDHQDDRGVKRWFTLSSAPGHELISITTKHAPRSSSFKKRLKELQPTESVDISEPMGDFVLPKDTKQPLVFIAGGIGITPFHSIVQWLEDNRQQRAIQFVYSVNTDDEVIFGTVFDQPWIKTIRRIAQPKLTAKEIVTLVDGVAGKQVFISGPEPMAESIVAQFKELGITQDQLITDYFPGYSEN